MMRPGSTKMIAASVPAAEAIVWTMLFSRMLEFPTKRMTASEITAAGIEVAKVRPTLSPRYTLAAVNSSVMTPPRMTLRTVSSRRPWSFCMTHSASGSARHQASGCASSFPLAGWPGAGAGFGSARLLRRLPRGEQPLDQPVEHLEPGHGDADRLRPAHRLAPDFLDLNLPALAVINQARRAVTSQLGRAVELQIQESARNRGAELRGRLENLLHQPPRQRPQALVGHDDVGRHAAGRDGETVERHVPDKFFPAQFLEIVLGLALDAGFGKQLRDLACAGLRGPAEFTEHHQAGKGAMHNPGRGARAADEADGPEHMLAAHHLGHGLLDAEAVLQRQHQRAGPHQRRPELFGRRAGRACSPAPGPQPLPPSPLPRPD